MSKSVLQVIALALVASASGCTTGGGFFGASNTAPDTGVTPVPGALDSGNLGEYLRLMDDLLEGDTVVQAEAWQRVSADEAAASNTTNRLRLALALAIPGHAGSNAEHAQRELRELLAAGEVLLPEERILASLLLAQIEQRLLLDLEAEQTQSAAIETLEARTRELEQRIGQLQSENQSLRRQLDEAQNVIDEISNIEQSIRERESAN